MKMLYDLAEVKRSGYTTTKILGTEESPRTVGWADVEGTYATLCPDSLRITAAFGRRINRANMGAVLRGRTMDGEKMVVRVGPRYR